MASYSPSPGSDGAQRDPRGGEAVAHAGSWRVRTDEWPVIKSLLTGNAALKDEQFQNNVKANTELGGQLREALQESLGQGPKKAMKKHIEDGMMLARDRVELLLDDDSPFLEICALAGHNMDGATTGASYVCGVGIVCGVQVLITASVPTIKGGSFNEATLGKMSRMAEIAYENRLPVVSLVQSAGADLSQQFKVFHKVRKGKREGTRGSVLCSWRETLSLFRVREREKRRKEN